MIFSLINQVPVTSNTVYLGIEILVGVIVSIIYVRSRIPKQTIIEQAQLIKVLQQKSTEQERELSNYKAQLAKLEGQLEAYKELPLQELANGIHAVSQSNQDILTTLQNSALTLATEKATL